MSRMTLFSSLGVLLRVLRGDRPQKQLAETLGITLRTYGRWERNEVTLEPEQLFNLAKRTAIPFEVAQRLSSGLPTLYHPTNRRFSHCSFDADFVNKKTLQSHLFTESDEGNIRAIDPAVDLDMIMRFSRPLYPESARASKVLLTMAIRTAPQLNLVCRDPRKLYVGHLLCFAVSEAGYSKLCKGPESEHQLDATDLVNVASAKPFALHIYSLYAACSTYAYHIVRRMVRSFVVRWDALEHCPVSRYVLTYDGQEMCRKLGMRPVDITERPEWRGEIPIHRYEARLGELPWLMKYRETAMTTG